VTQLECKKHRIITQWCISIPRATLSAKLAKDAANISPLMYVEYQSRVSVNITMYSNKIAANKLQQNIAVLLSIMI